METKANRKRNSKHGLVVAAFVGVLFSTFCGLLATGSEIPREHSNPVAGVIADICDGVIQNHDPIGDHTECNATPVSLPDTQDAHRVLTQNMTGETSGHPGNSPNMSIADLAGHSLPSLSPATFAPLATDPGLLQACSDQLQTSNVIGLQVVAHDVSPRLQLPVAPRAATRMGA